MEAHSSSSQAPKIESLSLNKIHFPITTLGYGKRVGLWFQGCSIGCKGCVSKDTWVTSSEHLVSLKELSTALRKWLPRADGITISGGEPFDQPEALLHLLKFLREFPTKDILVFSGYTEKNLTTYFSYILQHIDVLIAGPYIETAGQTKVLRGSDNQTITLLTRLAQERYPSNINEALWGTEETERKLDLFVDGDEIWTAGIPKPGDMDRLRERLQQAGWDCKTSAEPSEEKKDLTDTNSSAPVCRA